MNDNPEADAREPIRILHLSDFHFSAKTRADSAELLASLTRVVAEFVQKGMAPDLVAITGDVAHAGKKRQYDLARAWIDDSLLAVLPEGFSKSQILLVPGNHDADWTAVKAAARALQDVLLTEPSQERIEDILQDSDDRRVLLKRHAAYLKFAGDYGISEQRAEVPWWSGVCEIKGCRVHLAGLCSSWMSSSDKDQAKLLIGRCQVNAVLNDTPDDADLRIVMLHHPWDYLAEFDGREIQDTIHRRADLVLRGHLHAQRSITIYDPDNASLELAGGSVYDGSQYTNAFQLVEWCPADRTVRVHYRTWRSGKWLPDLHAYENTPEGIATFPRAGAAVATTRATPPPAPCDPKEHLTRLREQSRYIDLRGLQVGSGKIHRFPIDELYIPLTTTGGATERPDKGRRGGRTDELGPGRAEPVDLRECLKHRCLVVLGDPGSGKTTFLRRIAFELCRMQLGETHAGAESPWGALVDAFPLFIPLADLARHKAKAAERKIGPTGENVSEWLVHFATTRSEESGLALDQAFLRSKMQEGAAIVLLDALDEVPTRKERLVLRMVIENAARDYGRCRFVVTTRPAAFAGEVVLDGFEQARIAPLADRAVETFLNCWCHALWPDSESEARRHHDELRRPLEERAEIRRMARNPVMLTALAVVQWYERRLPEQRADLYASIIEWLAKSREFRPGRPKLEQCIALLQNLALAMQDHPKGRQAQVPRHWGARAIASFLREVPEDERVRAAETFLEEEEVGSGIVVGRGERDIRFWHLTFQEYLAARALAARSERVQAEKLLSTEKLYQQEWREVVLLLAGVLHRQGIERVDSMFETVLDGVGPKARLDAKARCAGLLNAVLGDLAPVGYKPADKRYQAVVRDALAVFDAKRSKGIRIEVAIEAAEAIGRGQDPRFADPKSMENWVTIPAGSFLMGAQKVDPSQPNYDPKEYGDESPVHEVHLEAYRIGRYPVTVAEYQRFINDGGYAKKGYWQAGGFGEQQQPDEWDEQLTHPNRPVVGVNWYEATAYAAWAETTWAGCRLPTEAEWERAARGPEGRRYPWGDDEPNPAVANYEGNVGRATPVGVYPRGRTPDGVLDLAGNVWEWCQDWYGDYPASAQVDPRGPASGEYRVLRGGSWDYIAHDLRCAYRDRYRADNRIDYLGCRVSAGT